ncbi:hypothetical protein ACMGDM_19420 [Sphingomonas sp. DT-51]|uniref:hypothetical protein n=1 Tax=Sphingomonas sp. DT-51 TaxID=3396165 RepID=UPI003F1AD373
MRAEGRSSTLERSQWVGPRYGKHIFRFPSFPFLFDLDGTILTSIEASRRVWGRWAAQFGLDGDTFLPSAHGMLIREVIAGLSLPDIDADRDAENILAAEMVDQDDVDQLAKLERRRIDVASLDRRGSCLRLLRALRPPR